MAVYKGDTEDEVNATDAYNMALQTLAESSVPLAAGGDFASTIRKNWPVGQMKFARGGYANGRAVKPVAGAVNEAVALAKKMYEDAIKAALQKYEHVGLRTVEEPITGKPANSRVWENDAPTQQQLEGVSATDANSGKVFNQHGLAEKDWSTGYYPGDYTYVLGSNSAELGVDAGEKILRDPVVLFGGRRDALNVSQVPVRAPDPYVKGVNDPKPELQQAIKDYYAGKLTREQYDDVVRRVSPVEPYDFIPQPSPEHLAVDALNAAKKDKYAMNRDIYQEGDPVSLRLDIPAYTNLPNSQWVNSIHDTRGVHPTTYDSVSAARNVDFVVPEGKARMTGEGGPKAPYAVMRGEYVPITAEEAVAQAQEIMGGPLPSQWQQVGMDPRRHSYFYTRDERMMPVTNADEVLQIGPVVYAKNPKVGEREDFGYARGGYATEGYVDDPQSARNVLQPADVKEWNYPTWIESIRDYLAEKGPQTGTGRPTLGGERVANGVRTVLQALPVSGQIDAAQRSLRSGEHGDYAEAGLDLLGMLPTAPIYRSMAREASPALRAASTAMMTAPALSEMGRPEYLDAPQTITRQELDSVPVFLAAQRSGQKRGMELPYRTAYADGGATDDVFHALRIAHDEANHYGDGGGAKITAELLKKLQSGLGKLMPAGSGYVPVANKPATVKIPTIGEVEARPIPEIGSAAEKYMRSIGREGEHEISGFPKYDVERARKIAQAYEDMQHDPTNPIVKRSYDALVDETMAQYRALKDAGFEFKFNADDPYALSPSMGYADVVNNGRLVVFPTETGGFGSSVHDQSAMQPLLVGVGQVGDLPNATANDAFRAVHDMFGHHGTGNPFFRDEGEERAWVAHKNMYSPEALLAMTNETRGQNSWVNYGPYGEQNRKAKGADTVYAEQKAGLLPEWTMDVPEQYARGGYADGRAVKPLAGASNEIGEAIATALKTLKGSVVSSPSVAKTTAKPARQFPELAERYPLVLPGRPAIDAVTGKEYIAKDLSDEAKAVAQARAIAQKEIKAGNFDPYFPPENRQPVDKGLFPQYDFDTTQLVASRPETFAKYDAIANDPRAEQSLIQMMLKGKESEDTASGWYHMNQLLEKYIEVYGPEIGPDKFRTNFAESMAATTGGMSPTNNFMLAHYGNFNANQTPWPSNAPQELSLGAYDMPYPIAAGKMGLRNNADAFNKMVLGEAGITPDNPKRFDFAGNFLGQDRAVMDEQMMGGSFGKIDPKLAGAPPAKMYGHFANKVNEIGQDLGMSPSNAQELGWFGAKAFKNPGKDIAPQPMIDDVNQAIERTHRITGLPHDEIVERGVVKQEIPLYAQGGAIDHALRLARGGYADGGIPMPNFAPQGPAIDIYSQVPGAGSFSFNPAKPTTVDNIPSGQQGPSSMPSPYTPTPAAEPAPAPAEAAGPAYQPEGGGGESGGFGGGDDGDESSGDDGDSGEGVSEKSGGRIWPKNNTGDNAVRLAHMIHHEMRSDPLFERKIQSILSKL